MPFIRVDVSTYEEIVAEFEPGDLPPGLAENRPSGEFEYQTASARFEPEALGPVERVMLEALLAVGATEFRVGYDGGYDEGFAYPESLLFGAERRPAAAALRELATPGLAADIREAAGRIGRKVMLVPSSRVSVRTRCAG